MSWTCVLCNKTFARISQFHKCEKIPVFDLFNGKPPALWQLYLKLVAELSKRGICKISTSSKAVTLSAKTGFMILYPKKDNLDTAIFLRRRAEGFPAYKIQQRSRCRFVHWIRLYDRGDLDATVLALADEARHNSL